MTLDHTGAIAKAGLGGDRLALVAGELRSASGGWMESSDPTTGQSLGRFPVARADDVDAAVNAAREAIERGPWGREWGPAKRAKCMARLAELCRAHEKDLARIEALDVGMPYGMALRFDVAALVRNLEYYASWADKVYGDAIPQSSPTVLDYTRREPYGVVAAVIPWNVPLLMVGTKLGPALATGNAVVLKPSEVACMGPLRVAELVREAGFPPGVVQVLSGDGETGRLLVSHPGVDKVSFTGGRRTAESILQEAGLKPTLFELGGKSPNIVFADADLDRLAMPAALGVFGLSGQACAAGSRLLVERSVHDAVVERICAVASGLPVGDPLDAGTLLGPMVGHPQRERVRSMVARAMEEGATLRFEAPCPDGPGAFHGPTVLCDVTPAMEVWREEVFGPVLAVTAFDTEEEAVALANRSEYGLAAGVWTRDLGRAHRVAARVDAGVVWVNTYGMLPNSVPFGGARGSGWGREGGRDALAEYTRVKNVMIETG